MALPPVFVFGSLAYSPLRTAVLGCQWAGRRAKVERTAAFADKYGRFAVTRQGDGPLGGIVIDLPDGEPRERLEFYLAVMAQSPRQIDLEGTPALLYEGQSTSEINWVPPGWHDRWGQVLVEAAHEVLKLRGTSPPERIATRLSQVLVQAASRVRAAERRPASLRHSAKPGDVVVERWHQPYAHFFAVEELDLRFRRFDGSFSAPVNRATFMSGDAVTVLPYDPVRDRVLLIEQFRPGPYGRGDLNPWLLEAIAGRIDAGETPEEAGRREAVEEASVAIDRMVPVGNYYPSPGAKTEYLYSFIGIADLPDALSGGIGGVEDEAEDIRSHLVPFDRLMELVRTGEAENGPLLLSALALERLRPDLRAA